LEVPEKDKKLLQRYGHGAVAVPLDSISTEVVIFGGLNQDGSRIADTVVVRFGKIITGRFYLVIQ